MEWHGAPESSQAGAPTQIAPTISFTEEQLVAMLEELRRNKSEGGVAACA